jgi:hypothetical protein
MVAALLPSTIEPHMNEQPQAQQAAPAPSMPNWQQIGAYLLWKFVGRERVEITAQDVDAFMAAFHPAIPIVFVDQRGGKFAVQLVSEAEAMEITKLGATIQTSGGEPEAPGSESLQ